ncbi:acetolactate synthase large subunit [Aquihabitans sp. G128]|nr:acetolactate synthase large subunit [Aquihabitans sp. G128]
MNGAQALIRTLVDAGVDVCFMNPGTSEMHFVAALDDVPEMHGVLALFEGVATGAADGYARMADKPAATLLHLGPGLGNGLANLHNARKGHTAMVNIVGDHATYHKQYDAQLESDIETVARNVSAWIRTSAKTDELAADAAEAVAVASGPPAQVATLILPADVSWTGGAEPVAPATPVAPVAVTAEAVAAIAAVLTGDEPAALFIGGRACRADALVDASRIANTTGSKLIAETFPARLERGAGRVPVDRLAYLAEFAAMQLDGLQHLVVVDTKSPVSFFAYPGKASDLVPEGCQVHVLAGAEHDVAGALAALADAVAAPADAATIQAEARPRAAHRSAHRRRRLQRPRRPHARGHDHLRRGQHLRPVRRRVHRRRPGPRLAHPHRRRHRPRPPRCARRRGGLPRPPGDRPGVRRLGHVHPAGLVDDGPRAARRDHGPVQQLVLRGPEHGAPAGRRHHRGREG